MRPQVEAYERATVPVIAAVVEGSGSSPYGGSSFVVRVGGGPDLWEGLRLGEGELPVDVGHFDEFGMGFITTDGRPRRTAIIDSHLGVSVPEVMPHLVDLDPDDAALNLVYSVGLRSDGGATVRAGAIDVMQDDDIERSVPRRPPR